MNIVKVADKVDLVGVIVKELEILRENGALCPRIIGMVPSE